MEKLNIAYFGGEPIGVPVLNELQKAGIILSLILCNPDRLVGRKQVLTAPPVKQWAAEHDIAVYQPESINDDAFKARMMETKWDLFVVVAYNKIMPKYLVDLPTHGTINLHPSLSHCSWSQPNPYQHLRGHANTMRCHHHADERKDGPWTNSCPANA